VALADYMLQVSGNRIGYTQIDIGRLTLLQEVIGLGVPASLAVISMKQPPRSKHR